MKNVYDMIGFFGKERRMENCIICSNKLSVDDYQRILRRHGSCDKCEEKKIMENIEKNNLEDKIQKHKGNIEIQYYDSHFIKLSFDDEKQAIIIQLTPLAMKSIKDYQFNGRGPIIIRDIPNPFKEDIK